MITSVTKDGNLYVCQIKDEQTGSIYSTHLTEPSYQYRVIIDKIKSKITGEELVQLEVAISLLQNESYYDGYEAGQQ